MQSTEEGFFEDQPRHFGVVLFFDVGNGRKRPVRFRGQADVGGFERFTHTRNRSLARRSDAETRSGALPVSRYVRTIESRLCDGSES